jgi:HEAT repeat protein
MPLVRKPAGASSPGLPARDSAAVLRLLATGADDERFAAARSAPEVPGGVAALGEALGREQNPRVREAIFTALARTATAQSVEMVLPFLRSDDALVRTGASDALMAMQKVAQPAIAALLRDPDLDVRILACGLVRNMPVETVLPLLCDLLDSEPEPNVCAAAVDSLAEIGGAEALPVLARCKERFAATPFLEFAIKIAMDRVRAQVTGPRA